MKFRVSDICQTASGGSYLAKYDAEMELEPGDGEVAIEVISTFPDPADLDLLSAAVESIRKGASLVLQQHGLQARLMLSRLIIHDTDCKPYQFEKSTIDALRQMNFSSVER